jgi:hypothetical protein
LVDKILGNRDSDIVGEVEESVCENCCRWFEPSLDHWNPVVSALILNRIDRVDDAANAASLREKATASIPIMDADPGDFLPQEVAPPDITSPDQIEAVLPLPYAPRNRSDVSPLSWMVGITTAPRRRPTIRYCIDSLRRSGWPRAFVFADGCEPHDGRDIPEGKEITWISRSTNVGGWSNFVLAAQELVHRNPDADGYLMLQDDALLARYSGLRSYVDRVMRTIGAGSIASLYCCDIDLKPSCGWDRSTLAMQRGAQGFAFGGEAMRRFVADPITRPWEGPWHNNGARPLEQRGIDGNIGRWAYQRGVPLWLPTPSLIWHLGETSTLWPGASMIGIRRAGDFLERHFPTA